MKSFFKIGSLFLISLLVLSCAKAPEKIVLKQGTWRGIIDIQGHDLPFNFEVSKKDSAYHINLNDGKENLALDDVTVQGDSVFIKLHIFDIDLRAKINGDTLNGLYIKNYADNYRLPFKATFGKVGRFDNPQNNGKFDGRWETTFKDSDGSTYPAEGVFKTTGNEVTGTFLTETGDYRFLEGYTDNDTMHLYGFDGNHAFVFQANLQSDGTLKGDFYSGRSSHETFTAKNNPKYELADPLALTYLKKGYDKISFSFPGLDGKPVSLDDPKYKGKVVVLQIFGTWCPNCMDETKFLKSWYAKNKDRDVAIIGLAYENPVNGKLDFNYAKNRVEKMIKTLHVGYDFAIAGVSNSAAASKTLPMLNKVMSFPTSIIIDKKGKVRQIHTGFAGPATGKYYDKYVEDFEALMNKLIAEKG